MPHWRPSFRPSGVVHRRIKNKCGGDDDGDDGGAVVVAVAVATEDETVIRSKDNIDSMVNRPRADTVQHWPAMNTAPLHSYCWPLPQRPIDRVVVAWQLAAEVVASSNVVVRTDWNR